MGADRMTGTSRTHGRGATRLLTMLVSALTVLGLSVLWPASTPNAEAAASDAPPVIFILDASGSMVREVTPGTTRMDVAKQALDEVLTSLPAGTQTAVLVFGTGTGNTKAEQKAGCADVKTLVPLGALNASDATAAVDAIKESGFTPIGPALTKAAALVPSGSKANIVLISDGVDTCAPPSSCEVASQVHRDNPGIAINVVGFGIDDDEAAQQQMTCIGGVGGGTSVSASDPTQLIASLNAATSSTTDSTHLSFQGLGGVAVGMSLDEVRAAVDGARVREPETVDGVVVIEVDCGWGTVELRDGRVTSITPKKQSTATVEGFTPGQTLEQATALYGEAVDHGTTTDGSSAVFQSRPGSPVGYRMFFDPSTSKVRYIIVCRCVPASLIASADPSTWEITYDGIGPLTLGMSEDEAQAALPTLQDAHGPSLASGWALPWNVDYTYRALGGDADDAWLGAAFTPDGHLAAISVQDPDARWSVDDLPDGARYPSARGVRLGEGMPTIVNAFPGGTTFQLSAAGRDDYVNLDRNGHLLIFTALPDYNDGDADNSVDSDVPIRTGSLLTVTVSSPADVDAAHPPNPAPETSTTP